MVHSWRERFGMLYVWGSMDPESLSNDSPLSRQPGIHFSTIPETPLQLPQVILRACPIGNGLFQPTISFCTYTSFFSSLILPPAPFLSDR